MTSQLKVSTDDRVPSPPPVACRRGILVSVEGITGVGKTHLTNLLHPDTGQADPAAPVVMDGFAQRRRSTTSDLGRGLLGTLIAAADGDQFLRGGRPGSETLLLLAIKMYDYESCLPALRRGQTVFEGRSLLTVAVYQALVVHSTDGPALAEARALLDVARAWRPPPDLTILIVDDVDTAAERACQRDGRSFTAEQRHMQTRAATLYEQLADDDPHQTCVLDRRAMAVEESLQRMRTWIAQRQRSAPCLRDRPVSADRFVSCPQSCQAPGDPAGVNL